MSRSENTKEIELNARIKQLEIKLSDQKELRDENESFRDQIKRLESKVQTLIVENNTLEKCQSDILADIK